MSIPIITLTTDFGTRDGFVGIMKGVILSIAPQARIVDVGHWVKPQDVLEGQFLLIRAAPYFPKGAIHVAVIDPDVGTSRKSVVVDTGSAFFVGPDNGLFTPWLDGSLVYHLNNAKYFLDHPSATFHGRDIFASVAAHIANGAAAAEFGPQVRDPVRLEMPKPKIKPNNVRGEIIHVDYFGNLITNIPASAMEPFKLGQAEEATHLKDTPARKPKLSASSEEHSSCKCVITVGREKIFGLVRTYGSEPEIKTHVIHRDAAGQASRPVPLIALIGSHGFMEIAVPMGNAQKILGAQRGDTITVRDK